ncbi:MAG: ATP-binding protein [Bacteriovorax sp.]|nr:ATP-binding protein [Bacteriovorax sp.]
MNTKGVELIAARVLEEAVEKAATLVKDAAIKAAILPKDAAEKAANLSKDAAEKAANLSKDAAEKAAILPKDAAEKAANLVKNATVKAALLPKDAAKKATLLLKEAAEKAALLPKGATEKAALLLNEAAAKAVFILKEESESLTAKKNKFLDLAAHELRNPIASISLLLQVIEKQIEKGQPLDMKILARLRAPTDRLASLVVDLLDMSGLERGMFIPVLAPTNIASLISECIEEFQILAPARSFIFHKPDQQIVLNIDPLRLSQVLANLLDNAIKYTNTGAIEVTLVDMSNMIRFSVTDHGAGISKEKQAELFTAFSRGSSDITVMPSGLGLGLSICRAIIDLHGGRIGVESVEGKGSTFYIELPKENLKV